MRVRVPLPQLFSAGAQGRRRVVSDGMFTPCPGFIYKPFKHNDMKILEYLKRAYTGLSRKKIRRTIRIVNTRPDGFTLSPALCREIIQRAYPDGARFLNQLQELKVEGLTRPSFLFDGGFATTSFCAAKTLFPGIVARAIADEVENVLKERSHGLNVTGVRVDGSHKDEYFVLQFRFSEIPSVDKECSCGTQTV